MALIYQINFKWIVVQHTFLCTFFSFLKDVFKWHYNDVSIVWKERYCLQKWVWLQSSRSMHCTGDLGGSSVNKKELVKFPRMPFLSRRYYHLLSNVLTFLSLKWFYSPAVKTMVKKQKKILFKRPPESI